MKILDVPQSGTAGNTVSYKSRYGQITRQYVVPKDPRTSVQLTRRKALGRARFLWRTVTDAQRAAWNAFAHGARTRPRLNQSGRLSGYLLFVKINCNLALVGEPMALDPLDYPRFVRDPVIELIITNTKGIIGLKLRVTAKLPQHLVILGTKPRSAGVSYVDHFAILGVVPEPVEGLCDITDLFVAKYGQPRAGTRVFIRTFQLSNGWDRIPQQLSAIVPAA
jgi:hypothetical protein